MQASEVRPFASGDGMYDPEAQQDRSDGDLRLQGSPCRWHLYCAESVMEFICGTLLIVIVYTEGSYADDGQEITDQTLNFLFLAAALSGLKYMAMRLVPSVFVGSAGRIPDNLGPISAWSRIAAHRRRVRARAWSVPAAAGVYVIFCISIRVWTSVRGLALGYLTAVGALNLFIALESFVAAAIGCRHGYQEVFPEVEAGEIVKPAKYRELARDCVGRCDAKCAICLQDFVPHDSAVRLPCNHIFHTECAGKWMSRGHGCPYRCGRSRAASG
mmetsp:Transcript_64766/g.192984  ORF Transcript_64766/g.192984 Transcript_64766/m.192984 type:complete len:272 (-) Transcript_64766:60-875(-)